MQGETEAVEHPQIPGALGDVYFGSPYTKIDWENAPDTTDDEGEDHSPESLAAVEAILGFSIDDILADDDEGDPGDNGDSPSSEPPSQLSLSGNVASNDFFADQIATKTGVSPELAKAVLLLGESAHGEPQNVAGLVQNLLSNSLHRDAAQHAIAFVAQSSGDPTLIRAFDDRGRLQYNAVQSSGDPSLLYRLSQGSGEGAEEPEPEFMLS